MSAIFATRPIWSNCKSKPSKDPLKRTRKMPSKSSNPVELFSGGVQWRTHGEKERLNIKINQLLCPTEKQYVFYSIRQKIIIKQTMFFMIVSDFANLGFFIDSHSSKYIFFPFFFFSQSLAVYKNTAVRPTKSTSPE